MPEAKILLGRNGNVATFKIVGTGSYVGAVGFRATYVQLLSEGVTEYVIDLGECEHLDSTFLGTILGLALKIRERGVGHVHVIKLNEMIRKLFLGTGLDQILDMSDPGEG